MRVQYASFYGVMGERDLELDGETTTLRQVLEAANALPTRQEKSSIVINGVVVTDLDTAVADGTVVTKVPKVEAG